MVAEDKDLTYLESRPTTRTAFQPGLSGSMQTVTRLVAEKQVIKSKHQLRPGPADLHLSVRNRKLGGIAYVYSMSDWSALMTP
jgi:hypothetical protein